MFGTGLKAAMLPDQNTNTSLFTQSYKKNCTSNRIRDVENCDSLHEELFKDEAFPHFLSSEQLRALHSGRRLLLSSE